MLTRTPPHRSSLSRAARLLCFALLGAAACGGGSCGGSGSTSRSCPFVFLYDGERYEYYTDLAGSVLAANVPYNRPEFYDGGVYELGDFAAHDGVYKIKIRETIHEADYFDLAELIVVDVPPGYRVLSRFSFTSQLGRVADETLVTIRDPRPPISAVDDRGEDVLAAIREKDGVPLPVTARTLSRVIVDLGPLAHPEHAKLIVTAWSHYAQLADLQPPPYSAGTTIETQDEGGRWVVRKVAGKNPGDRRTWAIDVGDVVAGGATLLRVTMAHQPFGLDVLDQLLVDDSPPQPFDVTRVRPERAALYFAGATRFSYGTLEHPITADDSAQPLIPEAVFYGAFTRYGDVRPLLAAADDRFVIMGHGDALELEFPDPPRRPDRQRQVLLDADVFYSILSSVDGFLTNSVEPLPFHGMPRYPYDESVWPYAGDADYAAYQREWNTRVVEP